MTKKKATAHGICQLAQGAQINKTVKLIYYQKVPTFYWKEGPSDRTTYWVNVTITLIEFLIV